MTEKTAPDGDPYYRDFADDYAEHARGVPGDVEFYVGLARDAPGPVVELGVGTGRIAIPAAEAGATVTAIDREPSMLAIARQRAAAAGVLDRLTLVEGDMRTFTVAEPAALVMIPFRTFLHNLTVEDQRATLEACRRALRPGGILALNVFNPDLSLIARWMQRSRRHWEPFGGRDDAEGRHEYEPSAQVVTTTVRVRSPDGRLQRTWFRLRYVHEPEMRELLLRCGFEVESCFGDFAGTPFAGHSPEMVWVARRHSRCR